MCFILKDAFIYTKYNETLDVNIVPVCPTQQGKDTPSETEADEEHSLRLDQLEQRS